MTWLLVLVVLAVVSVLFVLVAVYRRRRLSSSARARLRTQWERAMILSDPRLKILETEKVIDELLRLLGFGGTFADKLRRAGPLLKDTESVWQAHKLRNRIAHEAGVSIREEEARRAVAAFERALRQFL